MQYNMGIESIVFVLENNIAVLPAAGFAESSASTIPNAIF